MKIILASESPSKLKILKKMNLEFEVKPANIDETKLPYETATELAIRLAINKAEKIASQHDNSFIIAADTVSVCDNEILPKAINQDIIYYCLNKCSGKVRQDITGICVIKKNLCNKITQTDIMINNIHFNNLSKQEIEFYVQTNEAINTSGGFKIDGLGEIFINKIEGIPSSIAGLTINQVYRILKELDYKFN